MSIKVIILTLIVFLMLIHSIRERMRLRMYRDKSWGALMGEGINSPLSEALAQLVGVAGGVYLSVVMLVNFLELDVPPRVELLGVGFEPLASISILIAIVQPYILRLLKR